MRIFSGDKKKLEMNNWTKMEFLMKRLKYGEKMQMSGNKKKLKMNN